MKTPVFGLKDLIKKPNLENTFKFMGDNPNTAIWVACTIALFKGIFRPIFTMRDKKSDPETKKYTAIREGLTELIAIPVYFALPLAGKKFIVDKVYKNESEVIKKVANTNIKFWGVLAATAIIPAVCNLIQPPIMANYQKRQDAKKEIAKNNTIAKLDTTSKPSFSGNNSLLMKKTFRNNYGMRVGS